MSWDLRTDDDALLVLADLLASDRPGGDGDRRPGDDERYAVVPSFQHPRYLLPVASPTAAAAHLRAGRGLLSGLASHLLARPAIRAGALRLAARRSLAIPPGTPDHPTLAERLAAELGRAKVQLSLAVGPPRPNRKPVVRVADERGAVVAWAKVGTSAHAASLVRHEAEFLSGPGPGRLRAAGIETSRVLAELTWKGCPVVVASALPESVSMRTRPLELDAPTLTAIAACEDELDAARPADSAWWGRVETSVAEVEGPRRLAAHEAAEVVLQRLGEHELRFGRWHGDLAPWNAQWQDGRLLAWDWERTAAPVPLGFDALHQTFQVELAGRDATPGGARRAAVERNRSLLAELGVPPAAAGAMGDAYCLTFALRLLEDAGYAALHGGSLRLLDGLLDDLVRAGAS